MADNTNNKRGTLDRRFFISLLFTCASWMGFCYVVGPTLREDGRQEPPTAEEMERAYFEKAKLKR